MWLSSLQKTKIKTPQSVELHDWGIKPRRVCTAQPPALLTFGPDPKMNSNLFGWLAPIAASSPTSHRDHFPDWSLLRLIQAAEQSGANRCSPEEGRGLISAAFVVTWDFWFQTLRRLARMSASFYTCEGHKVNCIRLAVISYSGGLNCMTAPMLGEPNGPVAKWKEGNQMGLCIS